MTGRSLTILFLNAGRRVELMAAFRAALEALGLAGRLIASDIQGLAPALYGADGTRLLPHSSAPDFPAALIGLCREQRVDLIVPLIDPDLPVLAGLRAEIEATGARLLLSGAEAIAVCQDKRATAAFLAQHGFPAPRVLAPEAVTTADFPLLVKPHDGSAGANVFKVTDPGQLAFFLDYVPNALVQDFVEGPEYTVDVFCDTDGTPLIAVPRARLKVRAGEVSVGRVTRDAEMERLAMAVAAALPAMGPVNVQMILSPEGPRVIEINPRLGGGSQLSLAAGAPFAEWALLMALGRDPAEHPAALRDGITMMRYDSSLCIPEDEILG